MACTIACKQEHGFDADTWGIKVTEMIYTEPNGKVMVEFAPYPTDLCNLCASRIAEGEDSVPTCVHHCMTHCISYGRLSDLVKEMEDKPRAILYAGK
jgi:Fe-S-cluster-containing dehydrogenase component